VTRTELALQEEIGPELAKLVGPGAVVLEYGSGSSWKSRLLLDALTDPAAYAAIDISREHLLDAAEAIARDYPDVAVGAICADFLDPFPLPGELLHIAGRRLGYFPGSTIGNFHPPEAESFLRHAGKILGRGAHMIVGVDLVKNRDVLRAAYNDADGVTAAFNLNLLKRINRELSGSFDLADFVHEAIYNAEEGRIEMHIRCLRDCRVEVMGQSFQFAEGERIHTENSHKYAVEEFQALALSAGWEPEQVWTGPEMLFSLHYLTPAAV
jgi:dimethylhistidine N-methyltransferase